MREPGLAAELIELAGHDESVRTELLRAGELYDGYHPKMAAVHARNGDRLWSILDELGGWPGPSIVGADGYQAAWLIAQHAIANPSLMRRSRTLMADAVAAGEAEATDLARMVDRIRALEGRLQLYGTQLDWDDDGLFGLWPPIEEPASVDHRRAEVGLCSLEQHLHYVAERTREMNRRMSTLELARWRRGERAFAVEVGWRTPDPPTAAGGNGLDV